MRFFGSQLATAITTGNDNTDDSGSDNSLYLLNQL